ncbi:hypothetical protein [Tatumella sp. OPLPL6]|uniref:hypothetical protein n=1 Tax=Tatumella sp. OPLPL6 TaxID=1928657 RepID=UPI0025707AB8|nr:hypothetical protein [Tatumella sp. OPLPL6]
MTTRHYYDAAGRARAQTFAHDHPQAFTHYYQRDLTLAVILRRPTMTSLMIASPLPTINCADKSGSITTAAVTY